MEGQFEPWTSSLNAPRSVNLVADVHNEEFYNHWIINEDSYS